VSPRNEPLEPRDAGAPRSSLRRPGLALQPTVRAGQRHPSPLAFDVVVTDETVKTQLMQGHQFPAQFQVGATQGAPRKVTLPGISHRSDYRWAEATRGLNIGRIRVREWLWRWAVGQNPTGPIPRVMPPPVLRPLGHWKLVEKTLHQPHCRSLQTQTLPRITSRFANSGCLNIYFCLHLFDCIPFFFSCLSEVMAQFQELKKTRFINSLLKAPLSRDNRSQLPVSAASPGEGRCEGRGGFSSFPHHLHKQHLTFLRTLAGVFWAAAPQCWYCSQDISRL